VCFQLDPGGRERVPDLVGRGVDVLMGAADDTTPRRL
jgi:hypothetical protein